MLFLSLFLDLMLLLGWTPFAAGDIGQQDFAQTAHPTHGHFPGPIDPHFAGQATHLHHGQHGHSVGPSGGDHFH